jgi:hypothetical protein
MDSVMDHPRNTPLDKDQRSGCNGLGVASTMIPLPQEKGKEKYDWYRD